MNNLKNLIENLIIKKKRQNINIIFKELTKSKEKLVFSIDILTNDKKSINEKYIIELKVNEESIKEYDRKILKAFNYID